MGRNAFTEVKMRRSLSLFKRYRDENGKMKKINGKGKGEEVYRYSWDIVKKMENGKDEKDKWKIEKKNKGKKEKEGK